MDALVRIVGVVGAVLAVGLPERGLAFSAGPIQEGEVIAERAGLLIGDQGARSAQVILPHEVRAQIAADVVWRILAVLAGDSVEEEVGA